MSDTAKWRCNECGDAFRTTWGAIEHALSNDDVDIWPSYE